MHCLSTQKPLMSMNSAYIDLALSLTRLVESLTDAATRQLLSLLNRAVISRRILKLTNTWDQSVVSELCIKYQTLLYLNWSHNSVIIHQISRPDAPMRHAMPNEEVLIRFGGYRHVLTEPACSSGADIPPLPLGAAWNCEKKPGSFSNSSLTYSC